MSRNGNKIQVEDCFKLTIHFLKPYLLPGYRGNIRWLRENEERGSIAFLVLGAAVPNAIMLTYTLNARSGNPQDVEYQVPLTTTPLPWGGVRYWFLCPLQGCGRRVGCLYLPPGGKYFGCRHCHQLIYESQQNGNWSRKFFGEIAAMYQELYPGMNWKDARALWEDRTTPHLEQLEMEQYARFLQDYDPHPNYLTAEELCRQSGLTREDLEKLEEARLLVPDTKDGRYRPMLVGWGKKMMHLLQEGWEIKEIKTWSKERWKIEQGGH